MKFKKFKKKFKITPDVECQMADHFHEYNCTVFVVSSARAEAARHTSCDERKLLTAIKTGSLHAFDFGAIYTDKESDRGGAVRKAFNVNSIAAWACDDAAIVALHRQENAVRLNDQRTAPITTEVGGGSADLFRRQT